MKAESISDALDWLAWIGIAAMLLFLSYGFGDLRGRRRMKAWQDDYYRAHHDRGCIWTLVNSGFDAKEGVDWRIMRSGQYEIFYLLREPCGRGETNRECNERRGER